MHHTRPPFVRSLARSPVRSHGSPLGREGSTQGAILNHRSLPARSVARQIHCHTLHRSLARSPTHVSRSPLGRGRQHTAAIARSFARRLTARHWGMRRHKCTLRAHHWGSRGHRMRERRHRRRHKCTILNHHSFVCSLVRLLASALSRLTTGEGRVAGDTGGDASAPYSTTIRLLVRSFARSPIHVSRLTTGEGGFSGAPHSTIARQLARQFMSHGSSLRKEGRHWGTRRHK